MKSPKLHIIFIKQVQVELARERNSKLLKFLQQISQAFPPIPPQNIWKHFKIPKTKKDIHNSREFYDEIYEYTIL